MKFLAIPLFAFTLVLLFSACEGDSTTPFCETVVNPDGPGYLQVTNESGSTVDVYMGAFIPFGAEIKDGRCEIYGLPAKTKDVEFTRLSDGKMVVKSIAIEEDKTVELTLTSAFFN